MDKSPYAASGVDTSAGDRAVELMKKAVSASHSSRVVGGLGGFAGLYDASFLSSYRHPVLATSTDGGDTWKNLEVSEKPFEPTGKGFFGDYNNISAHDGRVRPIWTRNDEGVLSIWTAFMDGYE